MGLFSSSSPSQVIVFFVLSFFCRESLDRFVADNFPLKSSEFVKGTPKFNDYISAIDKVGAKLLQKILFQSSIIVKMFLHTLENGTLISLGCKNIVFQHNRKLLK